MQNYSIKIHTRLAKYATVACIVFLFRAFPMAANADTVMAVSTAATVVPVIPAGAVRETAPVATEPNPDITVPRRGTYGHSTAVGVNYPGANLKMSLSDKFAAEIRGQFVDKIFTGGTRLYYYPSIMGFNNASLRPFIALDGDYISFKGDISKGNGGALGGVGGVEYFLSRRLSVQTDIGPYCIMLKDSKSSLEQNGLEFVLNFGVNYYFK